MSDPEDGDETNSTGTHHIASPSPNSKRRSHSQTIAWAFPASRTQVHVLPVLEQARSRLVFIGLFFLLFYLAIIFRLFDVMIFNADTDIRGNDEPPTPVIARADILDRNGEILATSLPMASLAADPALVLNAGETLKGLKSVFPDLDTKTVLEDLNSKKRFIWIKRNLTPIQQEAVNRLGLTGLTFEPETRRIYPKSNLTAHIIGYNSVDHQGIAGIEKSFDQRLREKNEPINLSIDVRLQSIMHEALADGIQTFNALGGAGLIMDVHTGELLALVSLPDFDPNEQGKASDNAKFNRATLGIYEMGSTFKTFTLSQALDRNAITLADRFDCTHPLRAGKFIINDFHPMHRWLNVPEIYLHSSNIGAVQIAERVGPEAQKEFMRSLGLLDATPIEIPEVGKPMYPNEWRDISMMTIAYGHGIAVNAVQLASAVSSIINGGTLVKPTLLKKDPNKPEALGPRIIRPETSAGMRKLMRVVVTLGTGKTANVGGYVVGGKTGTADKNAGRGYNRNARLSSFIAAFPIQDPQYLVFVMIDEPKGNKESYGFATGGWVAAPAVGHVISQIAPLLNIAPVNDNDPSIEESLRLPVAVMGE